MTDHLEPDDPLDDLASAHLDGLTSPDEAAGIERDPELSGRVTAFAAARAAVQADTGPIDAERRDAAIAAAISAFDPSASGATVTPLSAARGRRLTRRVKVLGLAAAAAALAILVPVLANRGDDRSTTTAAGVPDSPAKREADDATASAPMASAAPSGGAGADSGASQLMVLDDAPVDLGTFTDLTDLTESVRARLSDTSAPSTTVPAPGATTTVPSADDQTCLTQAADAASQAGGFVVLSGIAEVDGRSVVVVVTEAPAGTRTLHVIDPAAGCAAVYDRNL